MNNKKTIIYNGIEYVFKYTRETEENEKINVFFEIENNKPVKELNKEIKKD